MEENVVLFIQSPTRFIAVMGNEVQLMDLETYETFTVAIPEDLQGELESGKEIHYMEALGRKMITRV
jgi:translation initiation factor 5A